MLTAVTAIRFDKAVSSGRTKPGIFTCVPDDGGEVELVVKLAAGCETKERSLVAEAIAAMMAADLDLPVPEPFVVMIEAELAATIPDAEIRERARKSVGWNFGSKKLPPGFATSPTDRPVPAVLVSTAAEILAFDIFIGNPDRTVANPNCLTNGRELAIYDHELAFFFEGTIGWRPPWETGSIKLPKGLPPRMRHVFLEEIRGRECDWRRLSGAFDMLTENRLEAYRAALPEQWLGDGRAVDGILGYLAALKQNVDAAIKQLNDALR